MALNDERPGAAPLTAALTRPAAAANLQDQTRNIQKR